MKSHLKKKKVALRHMPGGVPSLWFTSRVAPMTKLKVNEKRDERKKERTDYISSLILKPVLRFHDGSV